MPPELRDTAESGESVGISALTEKVDALSAQVVQLASLMELQMQMPVQSFEKEEEEEVAEFSSPQEKDGHREKVRLPKFAPPQTFDGTMKDTKSFISSIILYIKGREPEFCTTESKIMFALSYIQGGKAQFWWNEAINQIAVGHKLFRSFSEFLERLEMQFGDPNPKATAVGKLKTMRQGGLSADEFILQFKAEASQMELGDAVLIKYLKAGLNASLFKSIYRLPVMPTTLEEWYSWAFKLDWQYRQEQVETRLLHPHTHTSSKYSKLSGSSSDKGKSVEHHEAKAPPEATAVTHSSHVNHASEAMDVDRAGKRPPIKCLNCGNWGTWHGTAAVPKLSKK